MFTYKLIVLFLSLSLMVSVPHRIDSANLLTEPPLTLEEHIGEIFGSDSKVAIAVLKHESGLNLNAKGWNCIYGGKSTSCKIPDRKYAWSVDCGIAQVNVKGTECPAELLTLEGNMKQVERIYKTQGLNAWVSYKTGAYKKYL